MGLTLDRKARRLLRSLPYAVLTVIDDDDRILTNRVKIEAAGSRIVAMRSESAFPAGVRQGCVCAHWHDELYERFRQCVVTGEVDIAGSEARLSPAGVTVSLYHSGALADLRIGLETSRRGKQTLTKWGREPVAMKLLDKAFGG